MIMIMIVCKKSLKKLNTVISSFIEYNFDVIVDDEWVDLFEDLTAFHKTGTNVDRISAAHTMVCMV